MQFASPVYSKGNGTLKIFDAEGIAASPLWVQIWLVFMALTYASGLLFVLKQTIARLAVGGFVAGIFIGDFIFLAIGLPMLSGAIAIVHVLFWTPALIMLLIKRPFMHEQENMAFRVWSGTMTFVICFSFLFDIRDAVIYILHFSA
jgi:hypothetical protein